MDLGKWKSEVLIPFAHRQVFHKTRSSHSEEYHHLFCTYALQKIVKKNARYIIFLAKKVIGIENNSYICTCNKAK